MNEVRIATRRSPLAMAQARKVADMMRRAHQWLSVTMVEVEAAGDLDQTGPIAELTEIGAFVRAVQQAVLDGRADLAVHSLKDLPVAMSGDLVLAALPERAAPLDVMVGGTLDKLPSRAVIGTGSPRRRSQLLELRPDLETVELRGNIDTRLDKVDRSEVDAAILAEAGLTRLGRVDVIAQRFTVEEMVPAPGQGALAVEARPGSEAEELARAIDDQDVRGLATAERRLLAETGAGCRSALGALASREADGSIRLDAFVADEQGPRRVAVRGARPDEVADAAREGLGL
ncbi:MAG TPA: hydroxymethylbilane synthase [Acidimicrobiia bacterium]|nr:hydroxymethylbilane synthase [Acidimicrobiia bacterium]